ncbi:MAG: hypothetical protein EPO22_12330 [Dehalococcoidia bacterium]|nr:MAG: hypothetical protein EPO22_12330 [Dehalococcoidia bacterium]
MRLLAFVLALLLLAGNIEPTRGWLITLVVLTGLAAVRPRFWAPFDLRPRLDARLASFVLAILLLAGTIDPTRDWLIALAAVTGVAAFMPRVFALDGFMGWNHGRGRRHRRWNWQWEPDDDFGWGWRAQRPAPPERPIRPMPHNLDDDRRWTRWERRFERRMRRRDPFGDDWP